MRKLIFVLFLMLLVPACKPNDRDTASDTATTQTDTSSAGNVSSVQITAASSARIMFFGTICHVLEGASSPRAVVINSKDHPHEAYLMIPENDFENKPGSPPFDCYEGVCVAKVGEQTSIRLVDNGAVLKSGPSKDAGGFFDTLVPHLKDYVGPGDLDDLHDDVKAAVPPKGSVVRAYFELPGGEISASSYWKTACLKYKQKKKGPREFGREIILTSSVTKPVLRITVDKTETTYELKGGQPIEIALANVPGAGGMSPAHFSAHYEITKGKKLDLPAVDPKCEDPTGHFRTGNVEINALPAAIADTSLGSSLATRLAEVPGCSNTQWP